MSILTKLWLEVPFKLKDGWSGLLQLMELNLESKEMVKFKFHPEKKSISEKSLNFDRKYSGYIGNTGVNIACISIII